MTKSIDFYYDFASPNSYLANQVIRPLAERTGASVNYKICLLGGVFKATDNQAPWITFAPVKPKMAYMMVEMERYIKKHGLTAYKFNPHFPLNTLLMMRGAVAAEQLGRLEEYIAAGEKFVWEQELKMDDPEVFVKAFTDAGFDGAALLASTQDPEVKGKLIEHTDAAVERGIFGLPTFFVGDEMFFGKDQLHLVADELG